MSETQHTITIDEMPSISHSDDGWSWAIIEIMGFRKHAGRIREVEQFGTKMLRIDIPIDGDSEKWETRFYGGPSIFSITPTDKESVLKANKPYEPPALTRYRQPEEAQARDPDEDEEIEAARKEQADDEYANLYQEPAPLPGSAS